MVFHSGWRSLSLVSGRPTDFSPGSLSRPRRAAFLLMLDYAHSSGVVGKRETPTLHNRKYYSKLVRFQGNAMSRLEAIRTLRPYVMILAGAFCAAGVAMLSFVDREQRRPYELLAEVTQQRQFIQSIDGYIQNLEESAYKISQSVDRIDQVLPKIVVGGAPSQLLPDYVVQTREELVNLDFNLNHMQVTAGNISRDFKSAKEQGWTHSSLSLITTAFAQAPDRDSSAQTKSKERSDFLKEMFADEPKKEKKIAYPKDTPAILYTLLFIPLIFAIGGFYMAAFGTKKAVQAFGLDCIKTLIGFYTGAAGTFLAMLAK